MPLGSASIIDHGKLLQILGGRYTKMPSDPNDFKQIIQYVRDSDVCAIETYNKLA
jgi:ferritin-like protein